MRLRPQLQANSLVMRSPLLARATFDPKLKTYTVLYSAVALFASIAGIALLPFWILLGPWYARKKFEHLECVLTERALLVKRGVWIRHERTIPLDKIQDLALKEGPLLRRLGLSALRVETAGQNSQPGAEADLTGIVNVHDFRDQVLAQRDRIIDQAGQGGSETRDADPASTRALLTSIRDSLVRIEAHLSAPKDGSVRSTEP